MDRIHGYDRQTGLGLGDEEIPIKNARAKHDKFTPDEDEDVKNTTPRSTRGIKNNP